MSYEFVMRQKPDSDEIITDDYLEHKYNNSAAEHVKYVYSPEKTFHNYFDGYVAGFDVEGTIVAPWYPISSSQIQVKVSEYEMKKISSIQNLKKEIESKVKSRLPAGAVLPSSEAAKAAARLWVLYTDYKGSHNKKDMSHSSDALSHAQNEGSNSSNKTTAYVFDKLVKNSAGNQIGARFKGRGDREWVEIFVPTVDFTPNMQNFISLFNAEKGNATIREEEMRKAARILTNFFNSPSLQGNEKMTTYVRKPKSLKHSYEIIYSGDKL